MFRAALRDFTALEDSCSVNCCESLIKLQQNSTSSDSSIVSPRKSFCSSPTSSCKDLTIFLVSVFEGQEQFHCVYVCLLPLGELLLVMHVARNSRCSGYIAGRLIQV